MPQNSPYLKPPQILNTLKSLDTTRNAKEQHKAERKLSGNSILDPLKTI